MNKPLKINILISLLLLTLAGCRKSSSQNEVFVSHDLALDSVCAWLDIHDNFHKDNYYLVFNSYYNEKLGKNDLKSVTTAMKIVAEMEEYYLFFDSAFAAKINTFDSLYANGMHWSETMFIESHKGNHLIDRNEYRKAIKCFSKVKDYKPYDYDTYLECAYMLSDLAFCYSAIGEQEIALKYDHKALSYFDRIRSEEGKAVVYDHIALVHLFTKNYAEAENYFDKAMQVYKETGDTSNIFISMHNKLLMYEETNNPRRYKLFDSTYHAYMASNSEDPSLEVSLSYFYVEKLLHERKFDQAKEVLEDMEILTKALNSPSSDDEYRVSLAQYEIASGQGIMNTKVIEEALLAVEASEHYQNQLGFYEVLKKNALLQGDYKEALMYAEKEKVAQNGLANREMIVKSMELNKKHQTERKEHQIVLQDRKIQNKNITIALLLTALIIFCLIVVIFYYRQNQKKIRLESQRAILYTRQLLEKTEEERKRIASDLHDSVSHELLSLKNTIRDKDPSEKIDAIISDIRVISRNLHPVMFEKVGLVASLEQLVERTQHHYNLLVTTEIDYDSFLSVSDELQVYRIVQEALSNTIKYAEAFAAKIVLRTTSDTLFLEIKDNGKGFDVAEKLSGNTAFGLHNIIERSKAIGGSTRIYSDKSGTFILIEIKRA